MRGKLTTVGASTMAAATVAGIIGAPLAGAAIYHDKRDIASCGGKEMNVIASESDAGAKWASAQTWVSNPNASGCGNSSYMTWTKLQYKDRTTNNVGTIGWNAGTSSAPASVASRQNSYFLYSCHRVRWSSSGPTVTYQMDRNGVITGGCSF